jgi:polar amino acid transport system substrate-binding protein
MNAVLFCMAARAQTAATQPTEEAGLSSVRIVAIDSGEPFNWMLNGKLQGMAVDVAVDLAKRAGYAPAMQALPFRRAYEVGRTSPNVLLLTLARTPEREGQFIWLGPIAPRDVWLWKLKRRTDIKVKTLADAKHYKVGVAAGDAIVPELQRAGFVLNKTLIFIHDRRSFDRMLRLGRLDLLPMMAWVNSTMDADGDQPEELFEPLVRLTTAGGYYLVLGLGSDPQFVRKFQDAFAQMQRDGSLAAYRKQWIPSVKP